MHLLRARTNFLGKERMSHLVLDTPDHKHAVIAFPSHPHGPCKRKHNLINYYIKRRQEMSVHHGRKSDVISFLLLLTLKWKI
jgi:hypothetical protein